MHKIKAFTLVEVLIATVILVIIIGAVLAAETGNIHLALTDQSQIQANAVGQEGLNIVKKLTDNTKVNNAGTGACPDPSNSATCPDGIYYINVTTQVLNRCMQSDGATPATTEANCVVPDSQKVKVPNGPTFTRLITISNSN